VSQTRRLAAILAADVAGYSRLIGADEGGTLQSLKAIRKELVDPLIATHRGRLVKTTGDGLLVEFGSVVDALRCATEIQAGMAERNATAPRDDRIEFRMGLNVGDIVVEDGDIFGDGVNVAARLEGLAEPGGICVSARVQEDAGGKFDIAFEDIGEQQLKNICPARSRLPGWHDRYRKTRPDRSPGASAPRQTLGSCTAVHQHERRSRARVLRRWHCGRRDHRVVALSIVVRHRAQFLLHIQRPRVRREAPERFVEIGYSEDGFVPEPRSRLTTKRAATVGWV
jgi:class 3 adenylate cyclase